MADQAWVGAHWTGDAWLAVAFDREGGAEASAFEGIGDLWFAHGEDAATIVVDVPIGIPDGSGGRRRCDDLAREALGDRAHTVVAPPARKALRKRRYAVANRVNEREAGRELSEAAFEMREAIAVVDDLLGEFPEARETLAAGHPELAFLAFDGAPMSHDRDTAGGYAERLRTLAGVDRDAPPTLQSAAAAVAGHDVTVGDVLDALALAYTALPHDGDLRTLPADPPLDPEGLPMELVYRADAPLD